MTHQARGGSPGVLNSEPRRQFPRVERLPTSTVVGHPYAGFWRRLAAYLIDGLVLGVVQVTLAVIVQTFAPNDLRAQANIAPVGLLLAWAYFSLLESSPAQATLGKIALDIYVTDRNGDPIDFRRASIRYWAKVLSILTLMLGCLMAAFTPGKRALHDYLAGTLVLRHLTVPLTPSFGNPAAVLGERWDGSQWTSEPSLFVNNPK
jgi:uncharacterized RDD family membrane protein YckC